MGGNNIGKLYPVLYNIGIIGWCSSEKHGKAVDTSKE